MTVLITVLLFQGRSLKYYYLQIVKATSAFKSY